MHKLFTAIWFSFYQEKTGTAYIMDGQQGKHLKLLIKKIETKVRERGMEPTEENMVNSFRGFLGMISDAWILDHLDIALVNSKFNILYSHAVRTNPFTAADRIEQIIRRTDTEGTATSRGY